MTLPQAKGATRPAGVQWQVLGCNNSKTSVRVTSDPQGRLCKIQGPVRVHETDMWRSTWQTDRELVQRGGPVCSHGWKLLLINCCNNKEVMMQLVRMGVEGVANVRRIHADQLGCTRWRAVGGARRRRRRRCRQCRQCTLAQARERADRLCERVECVAACGWDKSAPFGAPKCAP